MVYDTVTKLAQELRESDEYKAFADARDRAMENDTTKSLIQEYHRLQVRAQAASVTGESNEEMLQKLQKIGELLQFDAIASAYLMTEFRLNRMLSDVYRILAEAIDVDLGALEA